MKADRVSSAMGGPSVPSVIRFMAGFAPVEVSCSCGSAIWVSVKSTRFMLEDFVSNHRNHGLLVTASEDGENVWSLLPKAPIGTGDFSQLG